jgi:hypothetical protein
MPDSNALRREANRNMTELKRRRRRAAPAGIAPNEPERDILDQYLYEVSTYPLLKGTEEIDLAKKIRAGDQDALQELVKRNLRFVISVAKKYQNRVRALGGPDAIRRGSVRDVRPVLAAGRPPRRSVGTPADDAGVLLRHGRRSIARRFHAFRLNIHFGLAILKMRSFRQLGNLVSDLSLIALLEEVS